MNILMVKSKDEENELIAQLRKMNSQEFEYNYLKLQDISLRRIN